MKKIRLTTETRNRNPRSAEVQIDKKYCNSEHQVEGYPAMERLAMKANKDFPVVCVGGSAGGLDAYVRLLRNLPSNMGVAIVIVNHLRTVATMLHEILRVTRRCRLS